MDELRGTGSLAVGHHRGLECRRMCDYRSNHAHERVVMVGAAVPRGRPQVTQESNVGRDA